MLSERRRHNRRIEPHPGVLQYAARAHKGVAAAEGQRARAFLAALEAGWTMKEIGAAAGISASTVCRVVNRYEESVSVPPASSGDGATK